MQQSAVLRSGDVAPDVAVSDAEGNAVQLSALWQDRPLLLAFLRHYG